MKIINVLIIALVMLTAGCATVRPIILHPIEKSDIFRIEKGAEVLNSDGTKVTTEKDGYFLSEFYLEEVIKARAE